MKLVSLALLASSTDAATVLMTNSAMLGGGPEGWNTTVWSVDTVTGDSQLVADTFDDRNAVTAVVCNNVYYSAWADISVGYGLRALDLASGESKDLPTTSLFHVLACDPNDNSKLLGTASDFTSAKDAYRNSRRTTREVGAAVGDAPFHLKSYDPATNTEVVVGTFPANEVKWGGYDGIFSFSQDGSEVWASWPADECPMCSDAKLGGHVHVMDTSSGDIKFSSDITFDSRKNKGTPYFILPDAKRGVFVQGHDSKRNLKWADVEMSGSSIKASITDTDATQLWDGAGVAQMCGGNVIAFERGSARYGGAIVDEISPEDGAIINSVDLLATLDIEGQDETSISAVACLTPSSQTLAKDDDHPHLAQAWQALSSGDGLPDQVGRESYIYEDCPGKHGGQLYTETCMSGHVWDYGADNCIKFEVNMGVHSKYTGTYYVKCDAVDCCKDVSPAGKIPDVKKWDIGQAKKSAITHMEATDLDDLDGHFVGADTWLEDISALKAHFKYTYYIHQAENGDIISHAIDYEAPTVAPGRILYGNFTVKHLEELDAFREVFKAPDACMKNNVLHCNDETMRKWDAKFQGRSTSEAVAV